MRQRLTTLLALLLFFMSMIELSVRLLQRWRYAVDMSVVRIAMALAVALSFALAARGARGSETGGEPGKCRRCGYDLRASPDRCPECGTPVAKAGK